MAPKYLLDANTFIESARSYYAFDLVPTFWQALIDHAANGGLCSIDRVKEELIRGNDALANWAANEFKPYFVPTDQSDVIEVFRDIMAWVQQQEQFGFQYPTSAVHLV